MNNKVGVIGECMLEMSRASPDLATASLPMNLGYGGDTLNAAVYLARKGIAVDYVTALGDDPMSAWMLQQWHSEGVGCDFVKREPGAVPGMYLIETDEQGERSFFYWRDNSPARRLLDDPAAAQHLFERLSKHSMLYLSGITLAIYSESARLRLFELLAEYRQGGGKVVFDGNYRPGLWQHSDAIRPAYEAMYGLTDIALPTIEDEQAIFGDADQEAVIQRLRLHGVKEIGLKLGESGCLVASPDVMELVAAKKVAVVDTTSAGDSFNAGYLAARLTGRSASDSASAGHALASVVIQHRGAIIPASAMPS